MAKRIRSLPKPVETGYVLFDVIYEDGSQKSNRRVPRIALAGLDADEAARRAIEEQDQAIAEKSGRPGLSIKEIRRARPPSSATESEGGLRQAKGA